MRRDCTTQGAVPSASTTNAIGRSEGSRKMWKATLLAMNEKSLGRVSVAPETMQGHLRGDCLGCDTPSVALARLSGCGSPHLS